MAEKGSQGATVDALEAVDKKWAGVEATVSYSIESAEIA